MMGAKEILIKGFNTTTEEDKNIINIAIKEVKREVFDDIIDFITEGYMAGFLECKKKHLNQ